MSLLSVPRLLTVRRHPTPDTQHDPYRPLRAMAALPGRVVLTQGFGDVVDQLSGGACTAEAMVAAAAWAFNMAGAGWQPRSALWQYWWERVLNGTTGSDSGATIQEAVQVAEQTGFIPDAAWPYDLTKLLVQPPASLAAQAVRMQSSQFRYLGHRPDPDAVTQALAEGCPIIFGYDVFPGLMPNMIPGNRLEFGGALSMPDAMSNALLGGHANVIVGYDRTMADGYYLLRNSWNKLWGLHGYFWMPMEYLELYGFDAYAVSPASQGNPQVFPVPSFALRALPAATVPQSIPASASPWAGTVNATLSPSSGTLQAGQAVTATCTLSAPLPPDQRVWLGYMEHPEALDGLPLEGWFWWSEMQPVNSSRLMFSGSLARDHATPQACYTEFFVRVLPSGVTPDENGAPAYYGQSPYPEAMLNGPAWVGGPAVKAPLLLPEITLLSTHMAKPDAQVTITGNGFDPGTQVYFGSTPATTAFVEIDTLTAKVPVMQGTNVAVTAKNPRGTSVVGPMTHFTVQEVAPVSEPTTLPIFLNGKEAPSEVVAYLNLKSGFALVPIDDLAKLLGFTATRDAKGVYITTPKGV